MLKVTLSLTFTLKLVPLLSIAVLVCIGVLSKHVALVLFSFLGPMPDNKQTENVLVNAFADAAFLSLETALQVSGHGVALGGDTVCHSHKGMRTGTRGWWL